MFRRVFGGLCSALRVCQQSLVCPAAPHPWDSWDSLATPQGQQDHSHHPKLCCLYERPLQPLLQPLVQLDCTGEKIWFSNPSCELVWVCARMKQSGGITWMIIIWHGYIGKALGGRWVLDRIPAKTSPLDFHGADDPRER